MVARKAKRAGPRRRRGGGLHPIDVQVGERLRLRRTLLGLSQVQLAQFLGLTFQQVQKYERGSNRIGASRLYDLCRVLDVRMDFLFENLSGSNTAPPGREAHALRKSVDDDKMPAMKRETLELVRAYYRISDPALRQRVFDLVKSIGQGDLPL